MDFGLKHIPKKYKYIVGIDEAGRGPVAGPVSVGLILAELSEEEKIQATFPKLKDSKKLTVQKREFALENIQQLELQGVLKSWCVMKDANDIDERGIAVCIRSCIEEGLEKMLLRMGISPEEVFVQLDGSLLAPAIYEQETYIKGDEKYVAIALASIVAKVSRDRLMVEYAEQYTQYGLEKHKGYGTKDHLRAVVEHGLSPIHRKTFLTKYVG